MQKAIVGLVACALLLAVPSTSLGAKTLAQRVAALETKMKCLKRNPVSMYPNYAWYEGSLEPDGGPYDVHAQADDYLDTNWAANFQQAWGDTVAPDYFLVAIHRTTACRNAFAQIANPYAAPLARSFQRAHLARLARAR